MVVILPATSDVKAAFWIESARSANVGTVLSQRRRQWANIVPTLAERLVFAGYTGSGGYRLDGRGYTLVMS